MAVPSMPLTCSRCANQTGQPSVYVAAVSTAGPLLPCIHRPAVHRLGRLRRSQGDCWVADSVALLHWLYWQPTCPALAMHLQRACSRPGSLRAFRPTCLLEMPAEEQVHGHNVHAWRLNSSHCTLVCS